MGSDGLADARIDLPPPDDAREGGLVRLILVALVAGAVVGVIGSAFRICLVAADSARDDLLAWTRDAPALRWVVPVVLAGVAVGLARLVVRYVPTSAGSGIQLVEASQREQAPFTPWQVIPAKFVGGVLAMGAGLALGREGPTVQMGAAVGSTAAGLLRFTDHDRRTLQAALAGAGLGVAFSAPLGGAMFVFEELARAIRTRLIIATLASVAGAIVVTHLIIGSAPVFVVPTVESGPWWMFVAFGTLGALLGALGPVYTRLVLGCLAVFERIDRLSPEVKAAVVGAGVGLIGVVSPEVVGGGEALNEAVLTGRYAFGALLAFLVVRWFLGPISYAPGTPGGLFAPVLLVGALAGAVLANAVNLVAPELHMSVTAMAIVGMSTFFAAVIRAPFTGILLIVEMTATTTLIAPMVLAAGLAVVVATMMRSEPVYDALRLRMLQRP